MKKKEKKRQIMDIEIYNSMIEGVVMRYVTIALMAIELPGLVTIKYHRTSMHENFHIYTKENQAEEVSIFITVKSAPDFDASKFVKVLKKEIKKDTSCSFHIQEEKTLFLS